MYLTGVYNNDYISLGALQVFCYVRIRGSERTGYGIYQVIFISPKEGAIMLHLELKPCLFVLTSRCII